jgi:hypothetical protein
VVAVGLTDCVPPLGWRVYELPLVPVNVTCVAFVAVTVKMDGFPAITEVGFAMMVTVGGGLEAAATVTIAVADAFPPALVADAL